MRLFTYKTVLLMALGVLVTVTLPAATIDISATANIFSAGGNTPAAPGGFGAGTTVLAGTWSAFPGRILRFSSVTGLVSCCGGLVPIPYTGPDGGSPVSSGTDTNINSTGGISGIQFTGRQMFLVGVFLDGSTPSGPAPAILSYTNASSQGASFSPLIGQTFFIGDGLTGTGSGAVQDFLIPATATRLFLGFADSVGFTGDAGTYSDNLNHSSSPNGLTAVFAVTGTPEPGTMVLMTLGLVGLAIRRFRRA